MDDLLNWLWQGCVVAASAAVILRVLHRSRAQFRYVLCWVVLGIVLTLPILPLVQIGSSAPSAAAAAPVGALVQVPNTWWTSATIVLSGWAAWCAFHGIRLASALVALQRAKGRCRPFPPAQQHGLRLWSGVRRRGRQTHLVLSDDVGSAAVLGCGSPVIAVAPALARHLDADDLDQVVIHEWAHVQRRDDLLNVAQLAVRAIAGWHPAVWWVDRQLQIEREAACDEAAVAMTGSAKGYAASLAKTASLLPTRPPPVPAVSAVAAPGLRYRIIRILGYRRLISARRSLSAVTTGALSVLGVAIGVGGLRLVDTAALAAPFELQSAPVPADVTEEAEVPRRPPLEASPRAQSRKMPAQVSHTMLRASASIDAPLPSLNDREANPSPVSIAEPASPEMGGAPPAVPRLLTGESVLPSASVLKLEAPASTSASASPRTATPWSAAADAGVSVGRASQKAAVATAGFFSRLGKKIAGSF